MSKNEKRKQDKRKQDKRKDNIETGYKKRFDRQNQEERNFDDQIEGRN